MCSQINVFGKVLAHARKEKQLSAYKLSQKSGINRKTILDIEKGVRHTFCYWRSGGKREKIIFDV